ncbi:ONECUT1 [Branchiostoma lanceolatum]|uniref:DNA-binding protein SATB n=1 Tax=Branchiostoma lanceolatum TaxID=7740 RepID=A0A8J9ZD65_BRALA|nr:ONECUT1 [Branchiostoma lanceolatum]
MSPEKLIHNVLDLKKLQREDTYICEKIQDPSTDNSTNIEEAKDTSENTTEEMEQNHKEHSPEVTYNNTAQVRETCVVDKHVPSYSLSNTVYITPTLSYTTQDAQNQKEMSVNVLDDTTDVLDTAQIANALRDTLVKKRLTQAMFSRLVLQRGQGTFSALMNNPRPWDKMHPRKQKLYKTMKQWMEPDVLDRNVQELRTAWKNYKMSDHRLKRKRQEKSTHKSKHASHSNAPSENQTALEAILTPEDSKIQDSLASQDAEAPSSSPHTQDPIMSEATPLVNDASERPTGTACTNQGQPFSDCVRPHKVALKLKQILKANKISYQMFARKVLRRSPGSLADLLNYPLAWHKMRPPRQKLYRTMWEWMSPCVVQKNIKELAKLRKNQVKREPTRFTKSQQKALHDVFSRTKYPTEPEIASLAEEQALSERAVSTWFQNRRSRYKIKYRNTREPSETERLINTDA